MSARTQSKRTSIRDEASEVWQHAGLDCAVVSVSHWMNGYVRIPEGHIARDSGYDTINRVVSVHGGLTYGTDAEGWVGFDTAHGGDNWPGMREYDYEWSIDWSYGKVVAEVNRLAEQLAAVTEFPDPESSWECTDAEFRRILRESRAWRRLRSARAAS